MPKSALPSRSTTINQPIISVNCHTYPREILTMRYVAAYCGAAVVFCVMDFIWLTKVAKNFYRSHMGELMAAEVQMVPAITFYVLYLAGLVIFSISPALREESSLLAVGLGLLLGI